MILFSHLSKLAELSVSHLVVLRLAVELLRAGLDALLDLLHQLGVLISRLLEPSRESRHLLLGPLDLLLDLDDLRVQTLAVLLQIAVTSTYVCMIRCVEFRWFKTALKMQLR